MLYVCMYTYAHVCAGGPGACVPTVVTTSN